MTPQTEKPIEELPSSATAVFPPARVNKRLGELMEAK
jgi:hypothetical protein